MTDEQVRICLWRAAVNVEFHKIQIDRFQRLDNTLKALLTAGTLAGISPIIKGLEEGVVAGLSWLSIGCGVFGLMGLPAFGLPRRIELLNEWHGQWVDVRQHKLDALQSENAKRSKSLEKGKQIRLSLEKETRRFGLLFKGGCQKKAEDLAENWFKIMRV
ncbi:MAG TPA: hypothetical protein VGE67_01280 [Haloferula sp.]